MSNEIKINPKKIVIDYIDSLVNYVDISTEEKLNNTTLKKKIDIPPFAHENEKSLGSSAKRSKLITTSEIKETDTFDVVNDLTIELKGYTHFSSSHTEFLPSGSIQMSQYLNKVRDEMIKKLHGAQDEALKRIDIANDSLKFDDHSEDYECKVDRVMEKAFAKRFPMIIEFKIQTPHQFNIFLLETDFYIKNIFRKTLVRRLYSLFRGDWNDDFLIRFGSVILDSKNCLDDNPNLTKEVIRIYMLGKYIDQMFKFDGKNKNPNDSKRILLSGQCQVTQKDLCNELIEIKIETNNDEIDIGYNQKDDEIDDQDLTRNITSLIIHNMNRKNKTMVKRLSGFKNLQILECNRLSLSDTSFQGLTRLKRLDIKMSKLEESAQELFQHIPQLECLVLRDFSGTDSVNFGHFVNLKKLSLENKNNLRDKNDIFKIVKILNHETLVELKIEIGGSIWNQFANVCPFISKKCKNLSVLRISGAEHPSYLAVMCSSNEVNSTLLFDINWLSGLTNLKELIIELYHLKKINLNFKISSSLPHLEELSITIDGIYNGLRKGQFCGLGSLKRLKFKNINYLDDNVFLDLVNLEHLDLSMEPTYHLDLTQAKLAGLVNLKSLNLSADSVGDTENNIDSNVFANMLNLESACLKLKVSNKCLQKLKQAYLGRINIKFN